MRALAAAILSIKPGALFFSYLTLILCFAASILAAPPIARLLVFGCVQIAGAVILFWHYCLYRVAPDKGAPLVGHRGSSAVLFVLLAVIAPVIVALTYGVFTNRSSNAPSAEMLVLIGAAALLCFSAIWASSRALVRVEKQQPAPPWWSIASTFIMALYMPLTAWNLYPRTQRLLNNS
ncbi:MAG: hypothetical protein NVV62_14845 [Terricaulis sp.]|nr:hypothetical protein [Terricaulis sp.]